MLNYKEDHAASSKELDAVHAYFEKLKPQCETKVRQAAIPSQKSDLFKIVRQ